MVRVRALHRGVDVFLALVAAVVGSGLELADPDVATKAITAPTWFYVALQVAAAAMLLARRRHPYAAALTIAAISLLAPAWAAVLVPYAVTAYGTGRRWRPWAVVAALTVAFMTGAHAWAIDDPITAPTVIAVSAVLGLYARARRRLADELAEQARAEERVRLAGEMHDVVTHRINLMVLQAGALRVTAADPATRAAAEELRVTGCLALTELRDLIGLLHDGSRPVRAVREPAAGSLESLVDGARAAGVPVRLVEDGDPTVVDPAVGRTLFRVVQESLTNVAKHAPGADTLVTVHYAGDGVRATVANPPGHLPARPEVTAAGAGRGLAGLRHRVEVVGGTLTSGSTSDGGFAVHAVLPAHVPAAVGR
ncbi:sensor histidine kinase [Asanoa siamensis]|uniref:histidine kinase n=1 Tax=Asanoa siamensis TaxID=926357 RepID=A0ABQ4CYR4_9ACTN|nr:histidine kinase [Asanoa siamensis]GIF76420.1 hypothetical protein Asi02nite_59380 [Asanoa siamensis]